MNAKTQEFIKIPSKVDDHDQKRFKDYDALIKCRTDIITIQEMRWIGQGCKRLAICTTAGMLIGTNSDAVLRLVRGLEVHAC